MNNKYEILKWDSDFFGFNIAKINYFNDVDDLNFISKHLKDINVKVCYISVEPTDEIKNKILLKQNAFLADEKVTFTINTHDLKLLNIDEICEYYLKEPTNEMISIALQSGEFSRFRVDKRFGRELCDKLYKQWIVNSVEKKFDNRIFIYNIENIIRGLVTLKDTEMGGSIGLIGVDQSIRGKNIGTKLLQKTFSYYQSLNVFDISVVTQKANINACHFYKKNGFKIKNVKNIYHLWL